MKPNAINEYANIIFRPMAMDDIPDIMVIEHEAFSLPWSEEAFRNEMKLNQFARYIVMELEGKAIGYAGMWTIVDEAHITNIALRTAYRGQRLGERLLCNLMELAANIGMIKMTLEVRMSNEIAQSLYHKMGFEAAGIRKGYYSDNHEDAIIMWCDLIETGFTDGETEGSEVDW